jgi:hypothetical protein
VAAAEESRLDGGTWNGSWKTGTWRLAQGALQGGGDAGKRSWVSSEVLLQLKGLVDRLSDRLEAAEECGVEEGIPYGREMKSSQYTTKLSTEIEFMKRTQRKRRRRHHAKGEPPT